MSEEAEAEDKTEAPSQRRLDKAREEGQVPLSREAAGAASLLGGLLVAAALLPGLGANLLQALRAILARAHELTPQQAWDALLAAAGLVLPVVAAAGLAALGVTLLQTGGLFNAKALVPKPSRLNPLAGLKRLLGPETLGELLKAVAKCALIGGAIWYGMGDPRHLAHVLHLPAGGLLGAVAAEAWSAFLSAALALVAVGAADLLWQRLRHLRRLRMSREEMKEEAKEQEGDPHVKGRLKQMRMSLSRRRMMAAVPKAAVVITNPTHYAVALAYEAGGAAAPRIVAKGADAVAARIREAARAAGVPLVSNPPLARALYKLELETEIPVEHYQAVASIIAFVLRPRARPAG